MFATDNIGYYDHGYNMESYWPLQIVTGNAGRNET